MFTDMPTQVLPLTPGTNKKMTEALKASFASWEKEQIRLNITKGKLPLETNLLFVAVIDDNIYLTFGRTISPFCSTLVKISIDRNDLLPCYPVYDQLRSIIRRIYTEERRAKIFASYAWESYFLRVAFRVVGGQCVCKGQYWLGMLLGFSPKTNQYLTIVLFVVPNRQILIFFFWRD